MKQAIFSVIQLTRTKRFSVTTQILKRNNKIFVRKQPNDETAIPHLNEMLTNYTKLKSNNHHDGVVYAPVSRDLELKNAINFNYIEGGNAERILLNAILEKNDSLAFEIIDKLISYICSFKSINTDPSLNNHYSKVFGTSYTQRIECNEIGIIDLNLDNIIIDKNNTWNVIDYEWVFPFPIPREYIIKRFFYWFFIVRFQSILRYHAERIEQIIIEPNISVPKTIYVKYRQYFENLENMILTEEKFQSYVSDKHVLLTKVKCTGIIDKTTVSSSIIEDYLTIPKLIDELNVCKSKTAEVTQHNAALVNELKNLENSRTFKFSKKIRSLKNILNKYR